MAGPALSQQTFDVWRESDREFKEEMRALLQAHASLHLSTEGRLSTVEANQEKCTERVGRRSMWLSAVVSAIIGGIVSWAATVK